MRAARMQSTSSPALATDRVFRRAILANQRSIAKKSDAALEGGRKRIIATTAVTRTDSISQSELSASRCCQTGMIAVLPMTTAWIANSSCIANMVEIV
jgi:hypothetical protein